MESTIRSTSKGEGSYYLILDDEMTIKLQTLDNNIFSMKINRSATVQELKDKINEVIKSI